MKKTEMIKEIATKAEVTQKEVVAILEATEAVIQEAMVNRDTVKVLGVTFGQREIPEKTGIIQLGENKGNTWHTDAFTKVTVKATKALSEMLK